MAPADRVAAALARVREALAGLDSRDQGVVTVGAVVGGAAVAAAMALLGRRRRGRGETPRRRGGGGGGGGRSRPLIRPGRERASRDALLDELEAMEGHALVASLQAQRDALLAKQVQERARLRDGEVFQELASLSRELLTPPAGQPTPNPAGARPSRRGSSSPSARSEAARAEAALSALTGPVHGLDDDGATVHRRYPCGGERPVFLKRRIPPPVNDPDDSGDGGGRAAEDGAPAGDKHAEFAEPLFAFHGSSQWLVSMDAVHWMDCEAYCRGGPQWGFDPATAVLLLRLELASLRAAEATAAAGRSGSGSGSRWRAAVGSGSGSGGGSARPPRGEAIESPFAAASAAIDDAGASNSASNAGVISYDQPRPPAPGLRTPTASPAAPRGGAASPSAALLAVGMLAAAPLAGGGGGSAGASPRGAPVGTAAGGAVGLSPRWPPYATGERRSPRWRAGAAAARDTSGSGRGSLAAAAAATTAVLQGSTLGGGGHQAAILPAGSGPTGHRGGGGPGGAGLGEGSPPSPRGTPAG
ncbi:hypothetical protein Rsub_04283 [Raphidocelis subcapitata]|uniref:Uncharacterized protein n=1 Tax=Raphidocelis subcapitata TaxID=307507 RepID=A0A2V0P118_9CHLO|nr:hypothetical protein Rsub_04283 [Raphidocelis subcapitata]|eukprot:GBF91543.1 hypothetical protein Rsub_04283 [Raphidocelis subcapitata]